jgi:acyl-CoA thioesterase-1
MSQEVSGESLNTFARLFAAALMAATLGGAPSAQAETATYKCREDSKQIRLSAPLTRMRRLITNGKPVTIMALGSSSTAGAGASSPLTSYPSRLEAELRTRLPASAITVVNRGVNGDEAAGMLERFDQLAAVDKPDVVLWQLGTNAALRDDPLGPLDRLIHRGLARFQSLGIDVVLIDPQFAPKVIAKADAEDIVAIIGAAATRHAVDLFPRFAVMRRWHETEDIPFDAFLSPDFLHMNDWGYGCFAKRLGASIAEAATRPVTAARSTR